MASDSFAANEEDEKEAVQVGDPFFEKLLLEATLEALDAGLVVGIQDMGAAGLTSSLFEMADRAKTGLMIDLNKVPTRSEGMSAYDLMLSESQERMAMVVEPCHWEELELIFKKWQLAHSPKYHRPMRARKTVFAQDFDEVLGKSKPSFQNILFSLLKVNPDKSFIYEQYDHHIGSRTCLGPEYGGAAVLWLRRDAPKSQPYLGVAVTSTCLEAYCEVDPYGGAVSSVLKSYRSIVAAGGEPMGVTDCLNYGNPENPEVMWDFSQGVDGIRDACNALRLPVVSGNVSLYNETDGISIPPTPMIGMVGKIADVREANPAAVKKPGMIWLLAPHEEGCLAWGGSPLISLYASGKSYCLPQVDFEAENEALGLLKKLKSEFVLSVRDVGGGGLLTCLAKMMLPHKVGLKIQKMLDLKYSFAERSGAYVLVVEKSFNPDMAQFSKGLEHCSLQYIGDYHNDDTNLVLGEQVINGDSIREQYHSVFFNLMDGL